MNVDPKGVTPGLAQKAQPQEDVIHLKCRNRKCDGITAVEIKIQGQEHTGRHIYRCLTCNATWGVPVGGAVNL